jgi:ATPase subunit of ABC transporter with duplicated ATPase domains
MQSSQLARELQEKSNAKKEQQIKHLQEFVARFSANASKSKQATSRKKTLEKIQLDDIKPSSRRYPFIGLELCRDIGKDVLFVEDLSGERFNNAKFTLNKEDKVVILADDDKQGTEFLEILLGQKEPKSGSYK